MTLKLLTTGHGKNFKSAVLFHETYPCPWTSLVIIFVGSVLPSGVRQTYTILYGVKLVSLQFGNRIIWQKFLGDLLQEGNSKHALVALMRSSANHVFLYIFLVMDSNRRVKRFAKFTFKRLPALIL